VTRLAIFFIKIQYTNCDVIENCCARVWNHVRINLKCSFPSILLYPSSLVLLIQFALSILLFPELKHFDTSVKCTLHLVEQRTSAQNYSSEQVHPYRRVHGSKYDICLANLITKQIR
jgi:hypothetical protein